MNHCEKAADYHHRGFNCCQSVLAAWADRIEMDPEDLKRMGAAFGGGMGGMEGPCGALCGAEMALGLICFRGKPLHAAARKVHAAFTEKTGSQICREIKGIGTGKMLCSCEDCIRNAVEALETFLEQES